MLTRLSVSLSLRRHLAALLTVCLLLSQLGGFAHGLTHLHTPQLGSKAAALLQASVSGVANDELVCAVCEAFDALASALPGAPPQWSAEAASVAHVVGQLPATPFLVVRHFAARAPPSFLA